MAVPPPQPARYAYQQASLWSTGPSGLLGDRRARSLGDILTVTIEIDDKAEMKNTTERNRERQRDRRGRRVLRRRATCCRPG